MKQPGQVVIFKFPQTNLEYTKARPALLLAKVPGDYDDWLIRNNLSQWIRSGSLPGQETTNNAGRFRT
jgi:hypothetical protein